MASPGDRALRLLGLAFLMVLVGGGSGYLFATRVLFPGPELPDDLLAVPDLRGLDLAEARGVVESNGLALSGVDSLRHPSAEAGKVLGQSPLPGQQALPGAEVRVSVSLGAERRALPDVVGLQGDRGASLLDATGFSVVIDTVESEEPRGSIIEQEPAGGTPVLVAGSIRLAVSLGPPQVEIPELTGLSEEEAVGRIEELGLEVGEVRTVFRFGRDRGLVVEQTPGVGTEVDRGTAVTLVVGRR